MSDELDALDDELAGVREDIESPEGEVAVVGSRRRTNDAVRRLLETPEVADMFIRGEPDTAIARRLGVSVSSVRNVRTKSPRMADLISAESSRIIAHLSTRDLGQEKYLGLATALGVMIEKEQLLRGEATSRQQVIGSGTVESFTLALFGVPRPDARAIGAGEERDSGECERVAADDAVAEGAISGAIESGEEGESG